MKLYHRIFIAYFFLLGLAGYYLYTLSVNEIKPAMRQSSEEILVDVANLLAEIVQGEFTSQDIAQGSFAAEVNDFLQRPLGAKIFSIDKSQSNLRIYITDAEGIVRYYSSPEYQDQIGKNYSQWNDVYLTLLGKYGARSTEDVIGNPLTTVMYVAAPIMQDGKIIGVLTVGKPGGDIQPFIDGATKNLKKHGLIILFISLVSGIVLSYWLTRSIRGLTQYAQAVSAGHLAVLPKIADSELKLLGDSIEEMRIELEGKNYVEQYVHSLTHELKSPISAIAGAGELISQGMEPADFEKLKNNILMESERLNDFVNRLLELVKVEKISTLEKREEIDLLFLVGQVVESKQIQAQKRGISINVKGSPAIFFGDSFLIKQAIDNLLQNALDFSANNSLIEIHIDSKEEDIVLSILDQGEGIPAYAQERIFERFYSLPRPNGLPKSSGIGLSFVQQVVLLHQGKLSVENRAAGGVAASIKLPKHKKHKEHIEHT